MAFHQDKKSNTHFPHLRFNDLSIFARLSFIIIFVFIAIVTLSFTNFINYKSDTEKNIKKEILQTNRQTNEKIDDYLTDLDKITTFPLTHKQNNTNYINELSTFNTTSVSTLDFQKLNEQMFNDIMTYKSALNSCYIFNLSGAADYKVKVPIYKAFNPTEEDWFQETVDSFGKARIVDTYLLPHTTDNKTHYVFGVARGIVKYQEAQVMGVLLINTDISYLRNVCQNMKLSANNHILILSGDKVIYDTNEENIALTADESILALDFPAGDEVVDATFQNQKVYISSILSDYSGWRIVNIIPTVDLYGDINRMQFSTFLISLIILCITVFLIIIISRQIVLPIRKLKALMSLAASGNFDNQIKIVTKDEIGSLATSFNHMIVKINNLIQEVYLTQIKQGETELQMLQSQINPHFLYNTLESISMMATINDDPTTSEMASDLGQILYYGISKNKTEVSLEEELSILGRYIHLQEIRFHDSYSIQIDVPAELYSITIIKLILQPVVENAIYHGMNTIRTGGKIMVTGYQEHSTLFLIVSDNGKGMDSTTVKNLNDYINDKNDTFKSIGLRNVNKRLKLRYGESYGLTIASDVSSGTIVTITLPVIE
ncbi:cache domain-containing sensor histidine kinase [Anaerosporobacter sp.]|uniref:cache domain-containing sensor histidine kinase n=1 Tax=Anaerosporobacter sp. TaxID=1872529 RepID=UPI00286F70E3|nr:sensor histidine kinase [Anaerosporobacter sp.]